MNKMKITIDGGCLQNIEGIPANLEIMVNDLDNQEVRYWYADVKKQMKHQSRKRVGAVRKNMRELRSMINSGELNMDGDEIRETAKLFIEEARDFNIGRYRFIRRNQIDEIMTEELESDLYVLGCFKASFLADFLPLSKTADFYIFKIN